jgi:hypothetical protein
MVAKCVTSCWRKVTNVTLTLARPYLQDEDDEGNLPDIDPEEQARTDNRTADEELRCVLAVIRHGGE